MALASRLARRLSLVHNDSLANHDRRDGLDEDRCGVDTSRRGAQALGTAHHLPGKNLEALKPGLGHAIDGWRARTVVGFGERMVLNVAGHGRELGLYEGTVDVPPVLLERVDLPAFATR